LSRLNLSIIKSHPTYHQSILSKGYTTSLGDCALSELLACKQIDWVFYEEVLTSKLRTQKV